MKRTFLFLLIVLPMVLFSQNQRVKVLRAIVFSDSIHVERASVNNVTAGTYTMTDDLGQFSIFALEDDVIMISGVAFETKQIIVKASDFKEMIFKIHIDIKINQLDEVKIAPYKLSGDLVYDAKRIKVKPTFKVDLPKIDIKNMEITGVKTRVENAFTPNEMKPLGGVDFIKLGGILVDLLKGSSKNTIKIEKKEITSADFETEISKRFSDDFFLKTFKINKDEKTLFIKYCYSKEVNEKALLEFKNSLLLIEYMVAKSEDFRK
ncbi:hypothetical protein OX283_000440 [Flavobacterium sp. SUN052]|uniref:hypothetical protein n=1 Tax=Flavobacterium sp. SUN052 TaxID=3002441 RepID=UPI00237E72F9|nr:hypothetical protein [Flavobacterium sp. SUN052]MEC4003110.1 hypothetical protein [Flavobacterium sp. SUN052]